MYFYFAAHRIWGERELDTMLRLTYACGQNPRTLFYEFEEYQEIRISNGNSPKPRPIWWRAAYHRPLFL